MGRALPLVAICLSILALAAAVMPRGDPPPPAPPPEDAPVVVQADVDALRRRVALLEDEQRALWERLVTLERRPVAMVDGGVSAPPAVAAEARADVRELLSGVAPADEARRAALREFIDEALSERRRERLVQGEARRAAQAEARKERWKAFVVTAKLTWAQEQKLTERLELEDRERQRLLAQVQSGEQSWREMNQLLREQRRETDQVMAGVLDQVQQQQYLEQRREDSGRGSRRRDAEAGGDPGPGR